MSVYKTDSEIPALWQVGDLMLDEIEVKAKLGASHLGARDLVYHRSFKVELAVTSVDADLFGGQTPDVMRQVGKWVQLGLHPHVVTCHYVREMGGVPRIFAEYVEGGTLADWIGERKLYEGGHEVALGRMLDVAIQVAWGLCYAHEKGVYHQNVTPESVMLMVSEPNSNPIAKLTDFGTPKAVTSDIYGWGLSVLQMFRGENEWQEGVYAADVLADVVKNGAQCADADMIPPMPTALADLLRGCLEEPAKKKAMGLVADELIVIYEQEMGQPYASKQPEPITLCADNLNNRAISLAEVGEMEEAMRLWQAAIDENEQHIEARYNLGVARWRRSELTDEKLLSELSKSYGCYPVHWRHKYSLAQVHLERWDPESAIKLLEEAYEMAPDEVQIQAALKLARADDYPTARCLRTLGKYDYGVNSVAVSGRWALSCSYNDNTVKVWDLDSGCLLNALEGHTDDVNSVAVSGRLALSGSRDKTVKVWDLDSGHCLHTLRGHTDWIKSVAVEGRLALSGSVDKTLKVWDLATARCVRTLKHTCTVWSVALSGRLALSGATDGTLKLWDLNNGHCLYTLKKGHTGPIYSVAISGHLALSGSRDKTVKLWDLTDGHCLRTFYGHTNDVYSVVFLADGRRALSGSLDSTAKVWDLASGRCLRTLEADRTVKSITIWGRLAVYGSKALQVWDLPDERIVDQGWQLAPLWSADRWASKLIAQRALRLASSEHLRQRRFVAALTLLQQARFDPLWISAHANLEAWWSLYPISRKKRLRAAWLMYTLEGHASRVYSVALQGSLALSGSYDRTVKVWDLDSGRCLYTLCGHTKPVRSVALCANGRLALSGSSDKTVKVWDLPSGDCLRTLSGHTRGVEAVAISKDARWALSRSWDSTLKVWDLASGNCLRTITAPKRELGVGPVLFSGDGRQVLSRFDDELKIWHLTLQRCRRTLKVRPNYAWLAVLKADDTFAFSGSWDETPKVWDLTTGECMRTLESEWPDKRSVVLSPDGRWAICGFGDGRIKVWALDWELETFDEADWDEGARVYLVNFLTLHTPFVGQFPPDREPTTKERRRAFTRRGKPTWSEEDFQRLLRQLQYAGYGWLRPEGVRAELMQMAKTWKKPPKL